MAAAASGLVVLGTLAVWACVWVLKPTTPWKRLWHSAEDRAAQTALRGTGLSVLVFCFPVLMAALMAHVYMHLRSRQPEGRVIGRSRRGKPVGLRALSNPVMVRSPIGTLSGSELITAGIFALLLAWTLYSNLAADVSKPTKTKFLHYSRAQIKVMDVGVRLGSLSEICLAVLLLPVLREMALLKLLGVQFEAAVRYHVWLGNLVVLLTAMHGVSIMAVWTSQGRLVSEVTKWPRSGRVNLAGLMGLSTGLLIWITSLPPIRRKQFQLFFSAHHLYIAFLVFFLLHAGDGHFYLVMPGVLLLALDKAARIVQSRRPTTLVSAKLLQCRAVELTLSIKGTSSRYTPTSIVFVNVPSISRQQWHPFSVISSSVDGNDRITFIAKCRGRWTDALYNKVKSMQSSDDPPMSVAVEGPYGPPSVIYQSYDSLVLVAGGAGVTPFLSVLQDMSSRPGSAGTIRRAQLVYVVKRSEDLSTLHSIFPLLLSSNGGRAAGTWTFKLKVFVTREERSGDAAPPSLRDVLQEVVSQVHTIRLAAPAEHSSSSGGTAASTPAAGFLVSAAVIGSASVTFLVCLVCLSHGFLPAGKTRAAVKGATPSWVPDLLVFASFVVAVACSAVFAILLRWLLTSKPDKEYPRPATDSAGGRLEMQSGAQGGGALQQDDHEIHFGKRPNLIETLEEILLEKSDAGGGRRSSAGIFVCGPDSMQEAVASFCTRTKQRQALTFHPITFSL